MIGQMAVASSSLLEDTRFPDTVCEAVKQADNAQENQQARALEVSVYLVLWMARKTKPDFESRTWRRSTSTRIYSYLLRAIVLDVTEGASTHYHATYVRPGSGPRLRPEQHESIDTYFIDGRSNMTELCFEHLRALICIEQNKEFIHQARENK